MTVVKRKAQKKDKRYQNRKNKVNQKMKSQEFDLRLIVNKSNNYVTVQAVDASGKIVASTSDRGQEGATKTERAFNAGKAFAEKIDKKAKAIFDRNGYPYHGRVKSFAEGLRD